MIIRCMLYILHQRRQQSHGLQLVCGVEISANMTILAVGGVCSIIYVCAQLQKNKPHGTPSTTLPSLWNRLRSFDFALVSNIQPSIIQWTTCVLKVRLATLLPSRGRGLGILREIDRCAARPRAPSLHSRLRDMNDFACEGSKLAEDIIMIEMLFYTNGISITTVARYT